MVSLEYCFVFSVSFEHFVVAPFSCFLSVMAFSLAFLYEVLFIGLCYSFSRVPFSSWVLLFGAVSWASPAEFLIS